MRQQLKLKVDKCVYHRNGISGIGFYAVWFNYMEDGKEESAIATVDAYDVQAVRDKSKEPRDPGTRILMLDEAGGVDLERTMRGDYFHEELIKWIIKNH